ncbi:MAG: DUF4381 domain-containing protein [Mesorhizobium sp.]
MEGNAAPALDAATRAALQQLADIALPPPVSLLPHTIAWAVVAILLAAVAGWCLWRWERHYAANRYRREALAELSKIEARHAAPGGSGEAIAEVAALVKRTALAAWPRPDVAALSGAEWVAFLRRTGGSFADVAAAVLDDGEYRGQATPADAQAFAAAARGWIERHRVPA